MGKHEANHEQEVAPANPEIETTEMSDEDLDQVSGGIIIVSGNQAITSRFDKVSLNSQLLPPKSFDSGQPH